MRRNLIAAAAIAVALCGCATGYHSATHPLLGISGGHWDQRGPGHLIKVGFAANAYSNKAVVADYLLYRCAEITQREGRTHFLLYPTLPDAIADKRSTERVVNVTFGKPVVHAYILMADADDRDALDAAALIARLGPKVKPAQEKKA